LQSSFLHGWSRSPEGVEARSGEAPVGGVKISDNWFSKDGIDGVDISYSSFMPIYRIAKFTYFSKIYSIRLNFLQGLIRTQNLRFAYFLNCDSLISCAPHKK
jgi:hypothetical protein